jgi:hypothetical protein
VNEPPVADERHDAPSEVDDFRFGEVAPQLVEELGRCRAMVAGENFRVVDRRLLTIRQ